MTKFEAKLMIVREDGVFFAGATSLVSDPEHAETFTDIDRCLNRIRDAILLGVAPVTQVRIIDTKFIPDK